MELLEEIGADGVRYWAASGRPGTDTAEENHAPTIAKIESK